MRDPFRQTSGIGRGSRRMACSLRQGAGNLWTATYWCGGSKACAQTPTTQPHPTTTWQGSACTVCGHVCASAFGLRSHMRRHKETRWAASSSNRRTTKRERIPAENKRTQLCLQTDLAEENSQSLHSQKLPRWAQQIYVTKEKCIVGLVKLK